MRAAKLTILSHLIHLNPLVAHHLAVHFRERKAALRLIIYRFALLDDGWVAEKMEGVWITKQPLGLEQGGAQRWVAFQL